VHVKVPRRWLVVSIPIALATIGCAREERAPVRTNVRARDPELPQLQGTWCIASDPLVSEYVQTDHDLDELRVTMRTVRERDLVRVRIEHADLWLEEHAHSPVHGRIDTQWNGTTGTLAIAWDRVESQTFFPPVAMAFSIDGDALRLEMDGRVEVLMPAAGAHCIRTTPELVRGTATEFRPPPATNARAPFAAGEVGTWPQIVLTNAATFRDRAPMEGASSFLLRSSQGVVLATARQFGDALRRGELGFTIAELASSLVLWTAYPRTRTGLLIRSTHLAMRELDDAETHDWLFFSGFSEAHLPGLPLESRPEPVELGERVFLVGCEYSERECTQQVYGGRITGRMRDAFRFELDEPVELRGFSGAPIVDANGQLVGVLTVTFTPFESAGEHLEAGGEDVAVGLRFLDVGGVVAP